MAANDGFYGNFPSQQGPISTDVRVARPTEMTGLTLPTSDPHIKGVLWSNSGVVTVSNG